MRTMMSMLVASTLCMIALPVMASPQDEAKAVITAWAEAYSQRDHEKTSAIYTPMARLRGMDAYFQTVGRASISEHYYFDAQAFKSRAVGFRDHDCRVFDDESAVCSGLYEVQQTSMSDEMQKQFARFSIALVRENGAWMIDDHHHVPTAPTN